MSYDAKQESPLLIVVRQVRGVISWTLPYTFSNGLEVFPMNFLCSTRLTVLALFQDDLFTSLENFVRSKRSSSKAKSYVEYFHWSFNFEQRFDFLFDSTGIYRSIHYRVNRFFLYSLKNRTKKLTIFTESILFTVHRHFFRRQNERFPLNISIHRSSSLSRRKTWTEPLLMTLQYSIICSLDEIFLFSIGTGTNEEAI